MVKIATQYTGQEQRPTTVEEAISIQPPIKDLKVPEGIETALDQGSTVPPTFSENPDAFVEGLVANYSQQLEGQVASPLEVITTPQFDVAGRELTTEEKQAGFATAFETQRVPRVGELTGNVWSKSTGEAPSYDSLEMSMTEIFEEAGKARRDPNFQSFLNGLHTENLSPQFYTAAEKLGGITPDGQINPDAMQALTFAIVKEAVEQEARSKDSSTRASQSEFDFEEGSITPEPVGIDVLRDSSSIVKTAQQFLTNKGVASVSPELFGGGNLSNKEAQAVVSIALGGLAAHGFFSDNPSITSGSRTFVKTNKFHQVESSIKDLIRHLKQGVEKDVTTQPNPRGLPGTEEAVKYRRKGQTQSNQLLQDVKELEEALHYYGTTPFKPARAVLMHRVGLLREVLRQPLKGFNEVQQQFLLRWGFPASKHELAGMFQLSEAALHEALNKRRRKGLNHFATLAEALNAANNDIKSGNPKNIKWIREASQTFRENAYNSISSNYELARKAGTVFYFPMEVIGVSGRMRQGPTTIAPQSNPSDRGAIVNSTPTIVQNSDLNNNSPLLRNIKAMLARVFEISNSKTVPSTENRIKIYEEYLGFKIVNGKPVFNNSLGENYWKAYQTLQKMSLSPDNYDLWAADAAAIHQDNKVNGFLPTSGVNPAQGSSYFTESLLPDSGLNISEAEMANLAEVLHLIKNGTPVAKNKEVTMQLSGLLTYGKLVEGNPFPVELTIELDGINNQFAFMGLLLGDRELAEASGLINPDLVKSGTILSSGNIRELINGKFDEFIDNRYPDTGDVPNPNRALLVAMRNTINTLKEQGSTWKKPGMVFGYGLTTNAGLAKELKESIEAIPNFSTVFDEAIKEQGFGELDINDLIKLLYGSNQSVSRGIMKNALGDALSFSETLKRVGGLGTLLQEALSFNSPTGLAINLATGDLDFEGHETPVNSKILGMPVSINLKEGKFKTAPWKPKPQKDKETELDTTPTFSDMVNAPKRWLSDVATWQGNRAPVLFIHALDAAVMVRVANRVVELNKSRDASNQIWFYQIFDAVVVDPKSYGIVQDIYNQEMKKIVNGLNPYKEFYNSLARANRSAIKNGTPSVAMTMLNYAMDLGKISEVEHKKYSDKIEAVGNKRDSLIDTYENKARNIEAGRTYENTAEIDKQTKEIYKELEKKLESPQYKISEKDMKEIFKLSNAIDDMLIQLRKQEITSSRAQKELLKEIDADQRRVGRQFGEGQVIGNLY